MTISAKKLIEGWEKDSEFNEAYDALDDEYALARAVISARVYAGLTQEQVAKRMGTSQSAICRLEGGRKWPSCATLEKFASATGTKLVIAFAQIESREMKNVVSLPYASPKGWIRASMYSNAALDVRAIEKEPA